MINARCAFMHNSAPFFFIHGSMKRTKNNKKDQFVNEQSHFMFIRVGLRIKMYVKVARFL